LAGLAYPEGATLVCEENVEDIMKKAEILKWYCKNHCTYITCKEGGCEYWQQLSTLIGNRPSKKRKWKQEKKGGVK
jgi:hypothetical protein